MPLWYPVQFVRLGAETPFGVMLDVIDRSSGVLCLAWAIHGLKKPAVKPEVCKALRLHPELGIDELELIPGGLHQVCSRFWAYANPVDACGDGACSIRLDSDHEASRVQGIHDGTIQLEGRLASRANHIAVRIPAGPSGFYHRCDILSGCILATIFAIRAYEVGVTELANRSVAILFTPRPEVTSGEATKDGSTSRVCTLALKRVENFFDGVGHGDVSCFYFVFLHAGGNPERQHVPCVHPRPVTCRKFL